MIGGIIVGHKELGGCLLSALKSIAGNFDNMASLSNEGMSTRELAERINETASSMNADNVLVFVDIYGGSCWQAAKIATEGKGAIITGVNLPMILSFIHKRNIIPFGELSAALENDGKRGIRST